MNHKYGGVMSWALHIAFSRRVRCAWEGRHLETPVYQWQKMLVSTLNAPVSCDCSFSKPVRMILNACRYWTFPKQLAPSDTFCRVLLTRSLIDNHLFEYDEDVL